jgi:ferric-dicitrate binding protein FerR (iron transport regulator)
MTDVELRERFRELRDHDASGAPAFRARSRPRRRRAWIALATAAGLVLAAVLIGLLKHRAAVENTAIDPDIIYWQAPTDALLRNWPASTTRGD